MFYDYGVFKLDVMRKDFSIVPTSPLVSKMVNADKNIEELIFKGVHEDEVLIQLFSSFTSLYKDEHQSFCRALNTYSHYHRECSREIIRSLGADSFEQSDTDSDFFELGYVDMSIWNKLMDLTSFYDLDSGNNDFGKFNANGKEIIMYNPNIQSGYNIKIWISPIEKRLCNNQVMLGWRAPSGFDRKKILKKEIFNAKESYDFLHKVMIPKAMDLKKKRKSRF